MTSTGMRLPPLARAVLPNGLTIVVLERRALPLVTLRLTVRAGCSRDPAQLAGLAALTARLLRRGAGRRDARQFASDLDFIGGHFGTGTGLDHLTIDGEFTTETLDDGLDLYLSAIFEPRFDPAEFERERQRALAEIVQARDEPDATADEAYLHFLYGAHPYGHPAGGTISSLRRMSTGDVATFHAECVSPAGAALVVVGDVDREAFLTRLRRRFAEWPTRGVAPDLADPRPVTGHRVVVVSDPGSGQVQYRSGNVGIRRRTPLWHALSLANTVFGGGFTSRLVREVRVNRGLTYGIGSRFHPARVPGPFTISTFTRNDSLAELHEVVTAQLSGLHRDGLTAEEIDAAKAFLGGLHVRRLETPEALAGAIAEAELHDLGHESITGFRDEIEKVTAEAATAAARAAVPCGDLLTVLVGDVERIAPVAETFGAVTTVGPEFAEDEVTAREAAP